MVVNILYSIDVPNWTFAEYEIFWVFCTNRMWNTHFNAILFKFVHMCLWSIIKLIIVVDCYFVTKHLMIDSLYKLVNEIKVFINESKFILFTFILYMLYTNNSNKKRN